MEAAQPANSVPERLYRIVQHNPPTTADFLSHAAKGGARPATAAPRNWSGVSLWSNRRLAERLAIHAQEIGTWIACLDLTQATEIQIEKTGSRAHFNAWGAPGAFLPYIIETTAVEA